MIGFIAAFGIAALLALIRLIKGPTLPDRMVAIDTAGTIVIAIIALLAAHFQKSYLVDIAIIYALLSFVATSVFSRHLRGEI